MGRMIALAAWGVCALFCIAFCAADRPASAQDNAIAQINALPWQTSGAGNIASVARVSLVTDLRFLGSVGTSRFLELNGNPPRNNQFTLAPESFDWFAIFGFDRSGYIRDDERLDADELLRTLQQQNEEGTAERRRLKLPILKLVGWAVPPHYDA
jgi:uncharacterized membrane-anchored protein